MGSIRRSVVKGSKEDCRGHAGRVAAVVDRSRWEGKEDCVVVCPYDVFEMATLSAEERQQLSFLG